MFYRIGDKIIYYSRELSGIRFYGDLFLRDIDIELIARSLYVGIFFRSYRPQEFGKIDL